MAVALCAMNYDAMTATLALRSYFRRRVDAETAEDLAQVVVLRAWQAGYPPMPWLWTVAQNELRRHYRRRTALKRGAGRVESLQPGMDTASGDSADCLVVARELRDILARVGPSASYAITQYAEGYSVPEIAAGIGRTHYATRQLMHRARVRLRDIMGRNQ